MVYHGGAGPPRAGRRPIGRRSVTIQQPFMAGGFSAFGYSHLLPKALEIEVLPGEIFERWRRRFDLPLIFRSLRGSMDLLAHFEPLNTNWTEPKRSNRHATCSVLPCDGRRLAKVQKTKDDHRIVSGCDFS